MNTALVIIGYIVLLYLATRTLPYLIIRYIAGDKCARW